MPCMRESWSYSASALSKSARRRRPLKGWALLDAAKASPHRPLPHCLFREYSRHMTDTLLPAQLVDAARKVLDANRAAGRRIRSEEHTSELQSLMSTSYAVFCLQKKTHNR